MGNEITCRRCGKTISDNPLVDSAAAGEGQGSEVFVCKCGERITYWAATAQLREQKRLGTRIRNWFQGLRDRG